MIKNKILKEKKNVKILKNNVWLIVIIILTIVKMCLISVQPVNGIYDMLYDDVLMVNQADSILKGEWLGEYNCLTLVKGPFTPLFIAFFNILHIPFLMSQEIFYDISIIFLLLVFRKKIKSQWKLILIYIVLLFNPITFCNELARVYRDGIYTSLIVFLIACTIGLFLNRKEKIRKIILYQIGLGITLSAIILCREETVWILPYLIGTILVNIIYILKDTELKEKTKRIITYLIPVAIIAISVFTVIELNYKYYGVIQLNQYWGKEFKEAYGALTRIIPEKQKRKVPITRETLKKAYEVSPKFAELEEYLEGEEGKEWAKCGDSSGYEIQGGWIHWAIMRAVESKGYYKDAVTANNYYEEVANEINQACDEGKIKAYPNKIISNNIKFDFEDIIKTLQKTPVTISYQVEYYLMSTRVRIAPIPETEEKQKMQEKFENVTREKVVALNSYEKENEKLQLKILQNIQKIYETINPIIFIMSIVSTIIYIIINLIFKKSKENVWILLGLWGLYYSRIFIITFTHMTMYTEAMNISYLAPTYVIQLFVSTISVIFLIDIIKEKIKLKNSNKVFTKK